MNIDTFLRLVASEPERAITSLAWTTPLGHAGGQYKSGILLTELAAHPPSTPVMRTVRYRHVLGPPAPESAIDAWQSKMPSHPLPADVRALIARVNGIHLWADADTGRGYVGLAPLEEWELARCKMYGASADPSLLDDRYLALSYHRDGAAFVVLDARTGRYFLMDTAGPDETCPIGDSVEQLLDWLWRTRGTPGGAQSHT